MGRKVIDLTGQVFGRLTVVGFSHIDNKRNSHWLVECSCGNIKTVSMPNLKVGNTVSCGCSRVKPRDITGKRYGKLVAIRPLETSNNRQRRLWELLCDCGCTTIVSTELLTKGKTKSCGCLVAQVNSVLRYKHGLSKTPAGRRVYIRNRYERAKSLDSDWTPLMELCLHTFQSTCAVCGTDKDLTVDHVKPLSRGYGLYPGNACILCKSCNSWKATKSLDQLPSEKATKIRDAAESFRIAWSGGF